VPASQLRISICLGAAAAAAERFRAGQQTRVLRYWCARVAELEKGRGSDVMVAKEMQLREEITQHPAEERPRRLTWWPGVMLQFARRRTQMQSRRTLGKPRRVDRHWCRRRAFAGQAHFARGEEGVARWVGQVTGCFLVCVHRFACCWAGLGAGAGSLELLLMLMLLLLLPAGCWLACLLAGCCCCCFCWARCYPLAVLLAASCWLLAAG